MARTDNAFLFDLDGTLVDSVYQHVLAWKEALDHEGIELPVWRIHRKIGMSGGLFTNILLRETGVPITEERVERLSELHSKAYQRLASSGSVRPLPGARELLAWLSDNGVAWAVATSGHKDAATLTLATLGIDAAKAVVVTRDEVRHAKPDPDLFITAAERLGFDVRDALVVGDSVWDMLAAKRARALSIGLLTGGYSENELERAGAYRVFADPADLLLHMDEVAARD